MKSNQEDSVTIKASEFKAKCLKIMDEVSQSGEEVVITKNGKPVSKLVPFQKKDRAPIFGMYKGKIKILGDITSPVGDINDWNAYKGFLINEEQG